jgi:hypothetical protein
LPEATLHGTLAVSISDMTVTSAGSQPRASATTCAHTVRCPWPCGVEARRTVIPPSGSIVIDAPSAFPDFGSVRARSSAVWASVM